MINLLIRMGRIYLLLVLYLLAPIVSAAGAFPAYSQVYDPARDPFADGRAALQLAKQTRRRVLIEAGGNWCSWCHLLDRFMTENKRVREKLDRNFVVLKINISEENDNADFMAGLPKPLGYPHIYISDADGRILYSKDTAELLEKGRYSEMRFVNFLDQWKQP